MGEMKLVVGSPLVTLGVWGDAEVLEVDSNDPLLIAEEDWDRFGV